MSTQMISTDHQRSRTIQHNFIKHSHTIETMRISSVRGGISPSFTQSNLLRDSITDFLGRYTQVLSRNATIVSTISTHIVENDLTAANQMST